MAPVLKVIRRRTGIVLGKQCAACRVLVHNHPDGTFPTICPLCGEHVEKQSTAPKEERMSVLQRVPSGGYAIERYNSREDWLQGRLTCIGGSDVSALFRDPETGRCINPWTSEYTLWAEKCGHQVGTKEESEAMEWGRYFEPAIAEWYKDKTGRELEYPGAFSIVRSTTHPHRAVSLDRIIVPFDERGPGCLSIKNVGVHRRDEWDAGILGEEEMEAIMNGEATGWEPPLLYQAQLQYEMGLTGFKWGSFAVCIGGQKGIWCDIDRDEEFIDLINRRVDRMWNRVVKREAPQLDGHESTTRTVKKLYGVADPNLIVDLSADAKEYTDELTQLDELLKSANERKEQLRNFIRDEMKDAVVGKLPEGCGAWTWKPDRNQQRTLRRKKK